MSKRALDSYPWITKEQQEPFRNACIAGADPVASCPLCGGRRVTQEGTFHYCAEHQSWEHDGYKVACYRCKVRWLVAQTPENHADAA